MFKRIIKDEKIFNSKDIMTVKPNNRIIHPITLNPVDTSGFINPICLTKMFISNNKFNEYDNYVCNGENKYKEYIQLPPISLDSQDLLEIYNINNIENLNDWINNNLITYSDITLSRVISCWITNNIDSLKSYKKYLQNICIKMISEVNPSIKDVDDDIINNYINNWIDNFKIGQSVHLYEDVYKFYFKIK
jgi:hypothetical protein